MKTFLFLILGFFISDAMSGDCLPQMSRPEKSKVVTGIGWTAQEATANLYKKLPQIGVLETLKVSNTRVKTEKEFSDVTKLTSDINVNIGMISTYNCRIDGQFAVSAIIPMDKVDYLPRHIKKDSHLKIPKDIYSFDYATKICGKQNYTVIHASGNEVEMIRGSISKYIRDNYLKIYIVCGDFEAKTGWQQYPKYIFKNPLNKYNLIYIGPRAAGYDIIDYSQHLQLEMIKNAMFN